MKIYCDGGSRGNPGPAASAIVVVDAQGQEVYHESKYLGETTNNVAEYNALIMALSWTVKNATDNTAIVMDSELVQRQMIGRYKVKNAALYDLWQEAKNLENQSQVSVEYLHTVREGNPVADLLVNQCLDSRK